MSSQTTIFRKDYQKPHFSIEKTDLLFELYEENAIVTATLHMKRESSGALRLYGDGLTLVSVMLDGQEPSWRLDGDDLIIETSKDEFQLIIMTQIEPQNNTALSGLYRSNGMFCTQCEAEGFRRMTYYLDRPDVMSIFSTKIIADKTKYPVLLSNGNLIEHGDLDNHRHYALWVDPFKKPSYLFALVAGDLAMVQDNFITMSGRNIDLRIYVEHGNQDKCAHAMQSLKKSMRWDEQEYGREYDLDIFMIVAVSDFNMGAMENKGLNIFNTKFVLARTDTATDDDFAGIESVVAHEYFHNWTGNRVTCRDWFQLSLKEGLTVFRDQEFSRDMNSYDVNRISDVRQLRNIQFPEDAGSMAHPVRPESYEEINNFYTATVYEKGAEVIRMQHCLLGKEGFRAGMDLYFDRHDGQAVTIDDFVKAMEDANNRDLTQFKRWYSQAGTPVVVAKTEYDAGWLTLTLSQSCPPTPETQEKQPYHMPIAYALIDANGDLIKQEHSVLELKEPSQAFRFYAPGGKPVISLLRGFSAPVKLQHDLSDDDLVHILRFDPDGFAKWDAAQYLMKKTICHWYRAPSMNQEIPQNVLSAMSFVLNHDALDMSLRAELLTPPDFEALAGDINHDIDPIRLMDARDLFMQQAGMHLKDDAFRVYRQLWVEEDGQISALSFAKRRLRHVCLMYLMRANEIEHLPLAQIQFEAANTMTDEAGAFALLANAHDEIARAAAIDSFYRKWQKDELVLDKWFAIQATSRVPQTLAVVRHLLKHPAFSMKNPNKVRSLIGAFCQANPRYFHAADGSGYAFLTEILLTLDAINPQTASRMVVPFTRYARLDAHRQALIQKELKRLAEAKLSTDLHEMVFKSLKS